MPTQAKTGDKPGKTAAKSAAITAKSAKPAAAGSASKPVVKSAAKPVAKTATKTVTKTATKTATESAAAKPAAVRKSPEKRSAAITAEQRRCYVEVAAYYIAERRGFQGGCVVADWAQAEAEIDRLLNEGVLKP